jgi:hypothetical protein
MKDRKRAGDIANAIFFGAVAVYEICMRTSLNSFYEFMRGQVAH